MIRTLLMSAALLFAAPATLALAAPCSDSPYAKVMPPHDGLTYGMSATSAISAAKRAYGKKARIYKNDSGTIKVEFHAAHQAVFDMIEIGTVNDVVTSMSWSYSNGFQRKMGGSSDAFLAILKRIKDTVGLADNNKQLEKGFLLSWNAKGGVALKAVGVDPMMVFTVFTCEPLEEAEKEKQRKSVNMGF